MINLRVVSSNAAATVDPVESVLAETRSSLGTQADAIADLATRVDESFLHALRLIMNCEGRLIVCGIGKSGLIGRKIAATFACSGTPAFFLHPAEAVHGDLGMITKKDALLIISNSGETAEIVRLLPFFRELGTPLISLVGKPDSSVARASDAVISIAVDSEACPHNLVPTTSAMTTLAMGDALAMAAMRMRNFSADDFGRFHPGGTLGRSLSRRVRDVMQTDPLPVVSPNAPVNEMLSAMTSGRCGLVIVASQTKMPLGIVTDGDLRRALQRQPNLMTCHASELMTPGPVTILESALLREAEDRMHRLRLKALVVVNSDNRVMGVVEIFRAS